MGRSVADIAGGWTEAGSLVTMTVAYAAPHRGASHAIVTPALAVGHRLPQPGPLAAKALGRPLAGAAVRPAVCPRPPHRHLLAPGGRHHPRPLARAARHPAGPPPSPPPRGPPRSPAQPHGPQRPVGRAPAAGPPAPAGGHRRHAPVTLRPLCRGLWHPPQPQPGPRRR